MTGRPEAASPGAALPGTTSPQAALLPHRGVLRITGEDRRLFLDNLVTASLGSLAPGQAVHAALLTPQGKIIGDFLVAELPAEGAEEGALFLDAPLAAVPGLLQRFGLYRLRAKVVIEDLSDRLGVVALWGGEPAERELDLLHRDPRLPAMGWRLVADREEAEAAIAALGAEDAGFAAWHGHRARLGLGEMGFDYQAGEAFPHEVNMDQLGGVDFRKGCYVGQEVVSRMQHRGTARTRLAQLGYPDGFAPEEGAEVTAGDRPLGLTGTPGGAVGLAMLRLDRAAEAVAAGAPILAGGLPAQVMRPAWWTAAWPLP